MSRPHKFMIVADDCSIFSFESSVRERCQGMYSSPQLQVVSCKSSEFADNFITVVDQDSGEHVDLLQDVDGNLWYVVDHMTRVQVVGAME